MPTTFSSANMLHRRLAQILSLEKMQLGFFIGAGCPVSIKTNVVAEGSEELMQAPLIPDVARLTALVINELKLSETHGETVALIQKALDEDEVQDRNIEVVLGFVRTLQLAAGKGNARGLSAELLTALDEAICSAIQKHVDKLLPDHETPYGQLAEFIAPRRLTPVELFTTNYDLLLEQALEEAGVAYFDGFVGARHPFFDLIAIEQDRLPERWARLWKLHGSINWRQHSKTKRVCRTRDISAGKDLLIHPSHRKYDDSRRMPYLALIDRLRHFLRNQSQPVALFVHGFSFSDEHLNDVIEDGLKANPQAACYAFLYSQVDDYPLAKRLALRCHNFTLLASDGEVSRGSFREWKVQQSNSMSNLDMIFEWSSDSFSPETATAPAKLKLGDFASFGEYLKSFISDLKEPNEAQVTS